MNRRGRLNPRTLEPYSRLDPHTLKPYLIEERYPQLWPPKWHLPTTRSRWALDNETGLNTLEPSRPKVGEWRERSAPHPTSGRKIIWRERSIRSGTVERHFLNPAIDERRA